MERPIKDICEAALSAKPLVSFCVKCYNQRQYIEAALDGAFAQTYRPLEIVISDDCSTDGSDGLISKKIEDYKCGGGDLQIVFNRNRENLGNIGNWIVFGELAHGELLIKADGDDVSLPKRTEKIVEAWVSGGKTAHVIDHVAADMDIKGRLTGGTRSILGAAQAYSRDCWDKFSTHGKFPSREWVGDDTIFSIRAHALAGAEKYQLVMDDVLVKYRCGSGASTNKRRYRDMVYAYTKECILYGLQDVELNKELLDIDNVKATRAWCLARAKDAALARQLAVGKSFKERVGAAMSLRKNCRSTTLRDTLYQILLALPPLMSDPLLNFYLKHVRRM